MPRDPADDGLGFYRRLRRRMSAWAQGPGAGHRYVDLLTAAPDLFHLLYRLLRDPEVPAAEKWKLAAALGYFVSPFDLVPEAIVGPVGYLDDIGLAAFVLSGLLRVTRPEVVQRHWAGRGEVLELVQQLLAMADEALGSGLWGRLQKLVGGEPGR